MAYTNGWYDTWWSDDCHEGDGFCDGTIPPEDDDAPGAECACICHKAPDFVTTDQVRDFHRKMPR